MGIRLGELSFGLAITAVSIGLVGMFPGTATAQEAVQAPAVQAPPLDEKFNRAFFRNEPSFFSSHNAFDEFALLFGLYYPENRINADGRGVDRLYRSALEQQTSSDPVLRTADLPNPFNGSLLTTPLVSESPIPPAPPSPYLQEQPTAPPPPAEEPTPVHEQSVPALW